MEQSLTQIPTLYLVKTKDALAHSIGVPLELVDRRAFTAHPHLLYQKQVTKKRNGDQRIIYSPNWPLKNIQKQIAVLLEEIYTPSSRASGYVKGRGIKHNASLHLGKRILLNIDLKDFFPSIHFGRIRGRLMAAPYNLTDSVSTTIARLCTLDGTLPIGSPSSPILSNIVCSHLDGLLAKLGRENGCFYSRYADDITFSTNRRSLPSHLARLDNSTGRFVAGQALEDAVKSAGFLINSSKTRVLDKTSCQEVCGVTINEFVNVPRKFLRALRGALNAWEKYGRSESEKIFKEKYNWRGSDSFETHLRGRLTHLIHIRGTDDLVVWKLVQRFNTLQGRIGPDLKYEQPKSERARLVDSVCRIESGDDQEQIWLQGSGIKMPDGRILTNHHNVDIKGNIARDIELYLDENARVAIPLRVVKFDKSKDVAILEPVESSWKAAIAAGSAELSFSQCAIGDEVKVGGYPSYLVGDSCQIASGEVRAFSKIENITYFRISVPIVKGNSGGPVFNALGQVIGVASRGIDTHEISNASFNGCLELFKIEKFIQS